MHHFSKYYFWSCWFFGSLFILGCAAVKPLPGGEKDETPPSVIWEESTPNFQVNFDDNRLELVFDEWVKLNSPSQQIVISPPLKNKPEVTLKGKKLVLSLPEGDSFEEGVTTIINFGESVQDYTEGNSAKDLQFVFSTGDEIDSLTCSGTITDIMGSPKENMWVGLYRNLEDSAIYLEKPLFLDKTDESGAFEIGYLSPDTYRIVAFEDGDLNLKYGETEPIAFLDSFIQVPQANLKLRSSLKPQKPTFSSVKKRFKGVKVFTVSTEEMGVKWRVEPDSGIYWHQKADSLFFFHPSIDSFQVFVEKPIINYVDTFDVSTRNTLRSDSLFKQQLTFTQPITVKDTIRFTANYPIKGIDTTKISIADSSSLDINKYSFTVDSSMFTVAITGPFDALQWHSITLEPGAIEPLFPIALADTVTVNFGFTIEEDLGNINMAFEEAQAGMTYVLLLKNGKKTIERRIITEENNSFSFESLRPGNYEVTVFEDENRNGIYDTGDYLAKRQPEAIFNKPLDVLRANWTLEVVINLDDLNN